MTDTHALQALRDEVGATKMELCARIADKIADFHKKNHADQVVGSGVEERMSAAARSVADAIRALAEMEKG